MTFALSPLSAIAASITEILVLRDCDSFAVSLLTGPLHNKRVMGQLTNNMQLSRHMYAFHNHDTD